MLFCRYDKCSAVQLCTSIVYGLSYHMPETDRQTFYSKVEAVYPTVMEAAMGNDIEDMPQGGRRLDQGQKRIPATSQEAEDFAAYVVKIASRRFSKATELARFKEVLIGTNKHLPKQTKVASVTTIKPKPKNALEQEVPKTEQNPRMVCPFCRRIGHTGDKCWKKHPQLRSSSSSRREPPKSSNEGWTKGEGRKPYWPNDDKRNDRGRRKQSSNQKSSASRDSQPKSSATTTPIETVPKVSSTMAVPTKKEQDFQPCSAQ